MADNRTQLSRELITSTATRLVAGEGLAALSMRRLAQELDVWPMSVYRHFRDKEDLLDAVAAAAAGPIDLPAPQGSWREQLTALAGEARTMLARQPVDLRRRTLLSPGVMSLTDAALAVLREAGLSTGAAATGWRTVLAHVIGSIELDAATGTEREMQAALLAVSEDEYPSLASASADVAHALAGGDAAFEEGLERVLDGIAAKR
jgi:AcrR family transcriptional regulator